MIYCTGYNRYNVIDNMNGWGYNDNGICILTFSQNPNIL